MRLLAGASGLDRAISHVRIQKSGLALAGHLNGVVPTRVQILGATEVSFVEAMSPEGQEKAAEYLFSLKLSCVLVTRGVDPPPALAHAFATFGVLMDPALPLSRRQHEMIATMVSITNACHY